MFENGYRIEKFDLPDSVRADVLKEDWHSVENTFFKLCAPGGEIFANLQKYFSFSKIEIMISIRESKNEWEEDGIWHDDGSRIFAFSLSLTIDPSQIQGGNLEIRRMGSQISALLPTPDYSSAIVFLTGIHGFEHRTRKVIQGKRIILVGWCS